MIRIQVTDWLHQVWSWSWIIEASQLVHLCVQVVKIQSVQSFSVPKSRCANLKGKEFCQQFEIHPGVGFMVLARQSTGLIDHYGLASSSTKVHSQSWFLVGMFWSIINLEPRQKKLTSKIFIHEAILQHKNKGVVVHEGSVRCEREKTLHAWTRRRTEPPQRSKACTACGPKHWRPSFLLTHR